MTIPDYDQECDCEFCKHEREQRQKVRDAKDRINRECADERRVCRL